MNSIELKTGRDASQTRQNPGDHLSHSPTQRPEPARTLSKSAGLQSITATVGVPRDLRGQTRRRRAPHWFWLFGVVSALASWRGPLSWTVLGAEDPPAILTPPRSQSVSIGATVVFRVSASGSQPLAMQWRFGLSDLAGATNATLTLTNVLAANAGPYSVAVSNAAGATMSPPANLDVDTAFKIILTGPVVKD